MKVAQVVGSFSEGDAIGNLIWEWHTFLSKEGHDSTIYSQSQKTAKDNYIVRQISELRKVTPDTLVMLHMCVGSNVNKLVAQLPCKKIMIYHNITPPSYFKKFDPISWAICKQGYRELKYLKNCFDKVICVSQYNKQALLEVGYSNPIDVLPDFYIRHEQYSSFIPETSVLNAYSGNKKNFLFVGRVVPNKKHEDIIRLFTYYQRYIDNEVRLIFVGDLGCKEYVNDLTSYVNTLRTRDVIFTGKVSQQELIGYYSIADIFLCMSEHEGFCVPLIEAMMYDIPVIAYAAAAIPDTLAGSGVLMHNKNLSEWSEKIHKIFTDDKYHQQIIGTQQNRIISNKICRNKINMTINSLIDYFSGGK